MQRRARSGWNMNDRRPSGERLAKKQEADEALWKQKVAEAEQARLQQRASDKCNKVEARSILRVH